MVHVLAVDVTRHVRWADGAEHGGIMYATINHWQVKVSPDELMAGCEAELLPELAKCAGFKGLYFVKEADDRCAFIVLWESPEALEAAQPTVARGWFGKAMFPNAAGSPQRSFGKVLVSR